MWFTHLHIEQNLQTAIDRYGNEVKRIIGVLNDALGKQRKKKLSLSTTTDDDPVWLVGDKCTYADLAFAPWNTLLGTLFPGGTLDIKTEFPEFHRWSSNVARRPATRKVLEYREECIRTMKDTGEQVVERQADAAKMPTYEPSIGVGDS